MGSTFISGDNVVIDAFVEFLHCMISVHLVKSDIQSTETVYSPRIQRKLRVENTAFYRKLLKEEFEPITSVYIVDE